MYTTVYTRGCKNEFPSKIDESSPFSKIDEHPSLYEGLEKWVETYKNNMGVIFQHSIEDTTIEKLDIGLPDSFSEFLMIETINPIGCSRTYHFRVKCVKYQDVGFFENIKNMFSKTSEPVIKLFEINGTYVI